MPDTKITALAAITTVDPANDVLPIVDVSDTSMAASGTTKKITTNQILGASGTATLASATITGDLTVDTSTLKVDSANNRVGIGTATPGAGYSLDILGAAVGGIRVSSNNYPNLVIDSANSNGALIYIQESGTTQARIGHLTAVTGLEFSGNNGTAATNVHYGIDSTGISTWKNVGGVAGTAMTLNATGLGVGVSPQNNLHIKGASGTTAIRIEAITDGTLGFIAAASGAISGAPANNLAIRAENGLYLSGGGNATQFILNSSGNVGIGVTPSAGGGCLQLKSGVTFPATQVASSDANTLDDYEEGTWTGTLKGSVSDPTTPVTATGAYTKVGRLVHITIAYSNVTTTGASGNVTITGLPFSGAATGAGSAITFDMFTTSTTLACWNVGTTIAFYVSGQFIPATHNAGLSRNLNVTFSYYV